MTTQNEYLSISGIEAYTADEVKALAPANNKIQFNTGGATQGKDYENNKFPATNAFAPGGSKFTHTGKGVGMWWQAGFNGMYSVDRVRILNRRDCCGNRLAATKVYIGKELCG